MRSLLLLLSVLASLTAGCQPEARPSPPPNVLVVLLDTTRADHLGLYGYSRPTSPFLDSIAERSAVFDNAHSSSSSTAPATSSLFTGLYPRDHGVTQGFFAHRREVKQLESKGETPLPLNRIPDEAQTLSELLQQLGYRGFGLGANINVGSEIGFSRGFQRFERMHRAGADALEARLMSWEPEIRDGSSPWFIYLHFNDPHEPYEPHEPWYSQWSEEADPDEEYPTEAYDSEIRFVDEALARIWQRFGDDGRTLLIVTSDHGEEFGDHGGRGHGLSLHRELSRIVLLVHPAGGLASPRRIATPVSIVDVLPTLEALLGQRPAAPRAGVSLAELVDGREGPEILEHRPLFAQKKRRWRGPREIHSVIQGGWKLIQRDREPVRLYDLDNDPTEQRNLAETRPERAAQLRGVLDAYRAQEPRFAPTGAEATLDRERLEHLRALGYVDP